jgi:hypothetical protein
VSTITSQKQLIATLQERVSMRASLVEKSAGSRADLIMRRRRCNTN